MSGNIAPFFVVGAARSGTTLLRAMLDRHSLVAIPPESHFIPKLWRQRRHYGADGRISNSQCFLADLAADPRFRSWNLPIELVGDELGRVANPRFADGIRSAFTAYARREGKANWADKTPRYGEHISLLATLLPEARFVHMIRDGRDVALSMIDLDGLPHTVASAAFFWSRRLRMARRTGMSLTEGRYFEVRYEGLVETPERTLRELSDFLGLDFENAMLALDPQPLRGVPPLEQRMHKSLTLPVTRGLRDWRQDMRLRHVVEFEAVGGHVLTALNYERRQPRFSFAILARSWFKVAIFLIASYRQRMASRRRAERRQRNFRPRS